jgi:hypothetical protein
VLGTISGLTITDTLMLKTHMTLRPCDTAAIAQLNCFKRSDKPICAPIAKNGSTSREFSSLLARHQLGFGQFLSALEILSYILR